MEIYKIATDKTEEVVNDIVKDTKKGLARVGDVAVNLKNDAKRIVETTTDAVADSTVRVYNFVKFW